MREAQRATPFEEESDSNRWSPRKEILGLQAELPPHLTGERCYEINGNFN